jgi:DNA modification methylase
MSVRILTGDCRQLLRGLEAGSVQTRVTSPPYFGLRDYGTGEWDGGDAACDHVVGEMRRGLGLAASPANTRGGAKKVAEIADIQARELCPHCGARRIDRQIGLEASPEAYVAELVAVFREVRRVLRDDGTLWLNLGDSYAGGRSGPDTGSTLRGSRANQNAAKDAKAALIASQRRDGALAPRSALKMPGLKPKDLIGIPWRVAFALQADGWYLRQDIIWAKPNPMPESVRDRCTKAHEYLFLLSKAPTYYFDAEAIGEASLTYGRQVAAGGVSPKNLGADRQWQGVPRGDKYDRESRNRRSVWMVATAPYREAHFATYPPELIAPCILAGSPKGGLVLDPFGGAGTTGLVADRLGRGALLIELNPDYAALAQRRLEGDAGLFAEVDDA